MTDKAYILNELDERTLLEQLAEESAELGQAALKYIRAHELSKNYTPKTEEEAERDLQEEFTDVCCVADMLGLVAGENNRKLKRWVCRLQQVNSTTMSYLMSGDSPAESIYKCESCGGTVSEETYSFCPWCGKRIIDYTYSKE